jgi:hypothetical protein
MQFHGFDCRFVIFPAPTRIPKDVQLATPKHVALLQHVSIESEHRKWHCVGTQSLPCDVFLYGVQSCAGRATFSIRQVRTQSQVCDHRACRKSMNAAATAVTIAYSQRTLRSTQSTSQPSRHCPSLQEPRKMRPCRLRHSICSHRKTRSSGRTKGSRLLATMYKCHLLKISSLPTSALAYLAQNCGTSIS